MDDKFIIRGGRSFKGVIPIRGSKNTVLPLIAASLLTKEEVRFSNVPELLDVSRMIELARHLGAEVSWDAMARTLSIRAHKLTSDTLDQELARKLRASVLFAGALVARLGRATLPYPGGDAIGARPLAAHVHAFQDLGISVEEGEHLTLEARRRHSAIVVLEETSVTATENIILAACLLPGKTTLQFAAREPHVQELVRFLNAMGAKIRWSPLPDILEIEGVSQLRGTSWEVNPDELEVSGFAALAAATRSSLRLEPVEPRYLDAPLLQLKKMRVPFTLDGRTLKIEKSSAPLSAFRLQSGLYPKLGSDHLPPFAVLATQAQGASLIHDWLYEGRFRYIDELQKMGATAMILDPHRALIIGPSQLCGREIRGLDIRSGMTLVIAALTAEGESTIADAHHLDRGYERIEERLSAVGADIRRIGINE